MAKMWWYTFLIVYSAYFIAADTYKKSPSPGSWDINIPYADWQQVAKEELDTALAKKPKLQKAKNVILFVGDGMGASTITATRMLKAQRQKLNPHKAKLVWDDFPTTGLSKTYNSDVYNGDSAATATAIMCGEKARQGTIGVRDEVERFKCDKYEGNELTSIFKHAVDKGKWAGIVTTTRLTHATPASTYTTTPNREWEASVSDDCKDKVKDVAYQLVYGEQSKKFRVMLGGGRKNFLPKSERDPEYPSVNGSRKDGVNLINEWKDMKVNAGVPKSKVKYVDRKSDFDSVVPENTDYLLGMFEPSHLNYEVDRVNDTFGEPSLEEMAVKALKMLQRSEDGYFLLVEGGRIDHAHHANWARRALEETLMMEKAVARAVEMTDPEDTLIIVSADHSHVFNIGADSRVGNDVFGWVINQFGDVLYAEDGLPEMLFKYANGPGWKFLDLLQMILKMNGSIDFPYDGPEPRPDDSHTAEDVPIYANGPWSHLFTGTHEQSYIAHVAMYASCVGPYQSAVHCDSQTKAKPTPSAAAKTNASPKFFQQSSSPGSWNVNIPYADWQKIAKEELDTALSNKAKIQKAKNVILFVGDGMGASTVTATRMLTAQRQKLDPDKAKLVWDDFPATGLCKTYNSDVYNGDSAATATAIMCGEKARQGTIGVRDEVERFKCDKYEGNELTSIFKHAVDKGKWAGIVTTTRLTHATPASTYTTTPNREWEASVADECKDKVKDVAYQLVHGEQSKQFKVMLGGGRKNFLPKSEKDPEYPSVNGSRKDGVNLIKAWEKMKLDAGMPKSKVQYVDRKSDFDSVNPDTTDYLLGMFEPSHLNYEVDRVNDTFGEPSLEEMAVKALKMLQRSEDGYFLLVEGGRIDHAHHANWARRALEETLMMEKAVARAVEMTDPEDTLIIVSADHSHVFNIGADSRVGNDVFGWVVNQFGETLYCEDGKPEMLFKYANGPGWKFHRSSTGDFNNERIRKNLTDLLNAGEVGSIDFPYDGPEPRPDDSHAAEDVPIYASGPWSHLFTGTHEQSYIAHVAMYASCVGPYQSGDHCNEPTNKAPRGSIGQMDVLILIMKCLVTLVGLKF